METLKLSFIVPVYNVAQYLRKCVDSLLAQDYEDYEIILVDDGSVDNSPQICDEYARMNALVNEGVREIGKPFIKVIHQENQGLSAARNAGVKAATGEYICFVDSDDYWEPNVLGGLMAQIERDNLDVLRFDFRNTNERYEEIYPNKNPRRDVDLSERATDGETFLNERLGPACYAVMFLLRRELLNRCFFKEGIYFEDVEWTPRMLLRAKRVASTPTVVYNYLWRTGSITLPDNPQKREKVLRDKIALIKGFKEQSKLVKKPVWFIWMTSFTTMSVLNMLSVIPSSQRKPYLQELRSLQIFPLMAKREKMLSHKIKIIIANISSSLYCNLMSMRK